MRQRGQSGTVEERGSRRKYWYGRWTVYSKDETGEDKPSHTGMFLGWKSEVTKGEARALLQKKIFKTTGENVSSSDKVTLEWFWNNRFRPMREGNWGPATADGNDSDWKHYISPTLGQLSFAEVDQFKLQIHLNELAKRGLSEPVVKRTRALLWAIFHIARKLKFIPENLMEDVELPVCKPTPKPTIPPQDFAKLYQALPHLRDRLVLRIGILIGLRTSELFGLTWDCWDASQVRFTIRNTVYKGQLREWRVKRRSSFRIVPVPQQTAAMLEEWRKQSSGQGLIFPSRSGKPLWPPNWLRLCLRPAVKASGITIPVTFQVLRRSFATRHRAQLKEAQSALGHASPITTAAHYAQAPSEAVVAMIELDEMEVLGGIQ